MAKRNVRVAEGPESVDTYIADCPEAVQPQLRAVRAAIRAVAPDAVETMRYFHFPGYSYPGYDYNGMFVWFSFREPYVRLHLRPPTIDDHAKELAAYPRTKAILSFPVDKPIPRPLVKKLVLASLGVMRGRG